VAWKERSLNGTRCFDWRTSFFSLSARRRTRSVLNQRVTGVYIAYPAGALFRGSALNGTDLKRDMPFHNQFSRDTLFGAINA